MGSKQNKVPPKQETSFVYKQMIKKTTVTDPFIYYQFFQLLGEGCYSQVFKARSIQTGQIRTIKKLEKGKNHKTSRHVSNQFQALKQMDHPNIIKMYQMFEDPTHYYIVTEYLEGKDVLQMLQASKVMSEEQVFSIFYQLLLAVTYIHRNKVMHRDLKLENIIYDQKFNSLKLIDFGSALKFEENHPRERRCTGTIHYIAPEVINKFYNSKCDIWSMGILLFVLLSGNAPFISKDHQIIMNKILNQPLTFVNPIWKTRSNQVKNLISKMLQKNFEKRISITQILMDPWICKNRSLNLIHKPEKEMIIDCLQYMQKFTKLKINQIQLGILIFMINMIIKPINSVGMMKVFNRIDLKQDGEIDQFEVKTALINFLDMNVKKAEQVSRDIIGRIDIDSSGLISFTQFVLSACNLNEVLTIENLNKTFDFIDTDNSGGLSINELRTRLGDRIEQNDCLKLIKLFGKDSNGQICKKQFELMMKELLKHY